jgi:hypothetical protein
MAHHQLRICFQPAANVDFAWLKFIHQVTLGEPAPKRPYSRN